MPPPPFQTFPKNIVGNTDVPQGVPKRLKLEFDPGEVGAVGMEILQNQNGPKVWATLSMLFSGIPSLAMFTAHSQLAKYLGGPGPPGGKGDSGGLNTRN